MNFELFNDQASVNAIKIACTKAEKYRKTKAGYQNRLDDLLTMTEVLVNAASTKGIKTTVTAWTNLRSRAKSSKYEIRIRFDRDSNLQPMIVLRDSLNGESSTFIDFGMYRLVCSNGLMVAQSTSKIFKQRHTGEFKFTATEALMLVDSAYEHVSQALEKYNSMQLKQSADKARDKIIDMLAARSVITETAARRAKNRSIARYDNDGTVFGVVNAVQEVLTSYSNGLKKQTSSSLDLNRQLLRLIDESIESSPDYFVKAA